MVFFKSPSAIVSLSGCADELLSHSLTDSIAANEFSLLGFIPCYCP